MSVDLAEGERLLSEATRAADIARNSPPGENPAWKAYDAAIGAFNGWVKRHGVALIAAAKEAEKLREVLWTMHDRCVGAHEADDPAGRAVALISDPQWGWLALCNWHLPPVDTLDDHVAVIRRDST